MVNQEILDYVKKELERGVSEDKLRHALMEHGWPEFEIHEAFDKAKEAKPAEEAPKEEVKKEKPFKEFLQGLGKEKPEVKEEAKPEEKPVEKPPIIDDVKKIVTNKIFIIAAIVIILGSVAYVVLPSFFEESGGPEESGAVTHAKEKCTQYCNSNLCGLVNDPGFTHPELEGKNCKELGFSCLQPNGDPKCETEY